MSSSSRRRGRRRMVAAGLAAIVALLTLLGIDLAGSFSSRPAPAPPARTPPAPPGAPTHPPAAWLGLDYNSGVGVGRLGDFAARGIVYDREGSIEVGAGETPAGSAELRAGLARLYGAGMVPDIVVNPTSAPVGCEGNPNPTKRCLPTTAADVAAFVGGFVATAGAVLRAHPGRPALFEPMNEPWSWASPPGTPSGRSAASQYATMLARLLPAARSAGIPLADVYVPATGMLSDGSSWIADLYRAQPCLQPGASSCGPIMGWNVHPYGLPGSTSEGIGSVPPIRAGMRSGRDNVVVSEIGFCANDVNGGTGCGENRSDIVGSSSQAAHWLRQTLEQAAPMHRAGWLRALIVWERAGTGFAMQNADGSLTAQGQALDLFADTAAGR